MTALQLDLFASDTDTRRLVDGLTCLRDAVPDAMYVLIHLTDWRPTENRGNRYSDGGWLYAIRRDGLRFEHALGWDDRRPAHRISWAELAEQLGDDPRRAELIAWSESLTEPAWKERMRPHELWPNPGSWHPSYITTDHEHPGWPRRIAAWRTLQAILTDAITRLDEEIPS